MTGPVSACGPGHLSRWIGAELWTVELDGDVVIGDVKVTAARGRLVERVTAWNADAAVAFTRRCSAFAAEQAGDDGVLAGYAEGAREEVEGAERTAAIGDLDRLAIHAALAAHFGACAAHHRAGGEDAAFLAAHAAFSRDLESLLA